jgi:hypothetical protein
MTQHNPKGDTTMCRLLLAAAMGGIALMSAYGTAGAQDIIEGPRGGVYIGPTYHDDYYDYGYSRRYYGYRDFRYDYPARARERRNDRIICGRYSYWDGNACQPGRRPY